MALRPNIPPSKPSATHSSDIHSDWVEKCIDVSHKLSTWEIEFIESIEAQLRRGKTLSHAQEATLERIYAEKTS